MRINLLKNIFILCLFILGTWIIFPGIIYADLSTGLVGHWSFDDGQGLVLSDSCPVEQPTCISNQGNLVNYPADHAMWVNGQVGKALVFDGITQYVDLGISTKLQPQQLTLSLWLNPLKLSLSDALGREQDIVSNQSTGGWSLYNPKGSDYLRWTANLNGAFKGINFPQLLKRDTFVHVVVTYDGTIAKTFLNGVLTNTQSLPGPVIYGAASSLKIGRLGAMGGANTTQFSGVIDDMRLYERPLTDVEVADLYNQYFLQPDSQPVTLDWPPFPDTQAYGNWDYVDKVEMGDYSMWLDALRLLHLDWKGIPILSNAAEMYWTNFQGTKHLDGQNRSLGTCGWYNGPKDIPIRIIKNADGVEYLWQVSQIDQGMVQVNRAFLTSKALVVETKIDLTSVNNKALPTEIVFHPVFFPGQSVTPARAAADVNIRNQGQRVLANDGSQYSLIYTPVGQPLEVKHLVNGQWERYSQNNQVNGAPIVWANNARGILFHHGGPDYVGVVFSAQDPSTKIAVWGNVPSPLTIGPTRDVIVPEITIYPTGTKYTTTLRMEIRGDVGGFWTPGIISDLPLAKTLETSVIGSQVFNLFADNEAISFQLTSKSLLGNIPRNIDVEYVVKDYKGQAVNLETSKESRNFIGLDQWSWFTKNLTRGNYSLEIIYRERGQVVAVDFKRIAVVSSPYTGIGNQDSYFGSNGMGLSFAYSNKDPITGGLTASAKKLLNDWAKTGYKLGVKKMRWGDDNLIRMSIVEPEQGNYKFYLSSDESIDILRNAGFAVWLQEFDTYQHIPAWAQGGQFTYHGITSYYPKDFKMYQDYLYQVANHFKGKIYGYELDNEPDSTMDPILFLNFHQAGYAGIKQADPQAKVLGTAMNCLDNISCQSFAQEVLVSRGGSKYFDIISPHYLSMDPDPELGPEVKGLGFITDIATAQNLELWEGEGGGARRGTVNGDGMPPEAVFPSRDFNDAEKQVVKYNVRSFLTLLANPKVKHISQCFDMFSFDYPGSTYGSDYVFRNLAISFFKVGTQISAWGVAYSTMANLFDGSQFTGRLDFLDPNLYAQVHEREGRSVLALWMRQGSRELTLDLGKNQVTLVNVVGHQSTLTGKIILNVGEEPQYLLMEGLTYNEIAVLTQGGELPLGVSVGILNADISANGKLTMYDAALAFRYSLGKLILTVDQIKQADANKDGMVNEEDVSLIAQQALR